MVDSVLEMTGNDHLHSKYWILTEIFKYPFYVYMLIREWNQEYSDILCILTLSIFYSVLKVLWTWPNGGT